MRLLYEHREIINIVYDKSLNQIYFSKTNRVLPSLIMATYSGEAFPTCDCYRYIALLFWYFMSYEVMFLEWELSL